MKIFGMGIVELLIVLVIVGVLFGPRLLKLGTTFKKTGNALREGIDEESRPSANAPAQPRPVAAAKPAASASTAKAAAAPAAAAAAQQQQAGKQPAKKANVGRIVSIVAVVLLLVALVLRLTGVWQ